MTTYVYKQTVVEAFRWGVEASPEWWNDLVKADMVRQDSTSHNALLKPYAYYARPLAPLYTVKGYNTRFETIDVGAWVLKHIEPAIAFNVLTNDDFTRNFIPMPEPKVKKPLTDDQRRARIMKLADGRAVMANVLLKANDCELEPLNEGKDWLLVSGDIMAASPSPKDAPQAGEDIIIRLAIFQDIDSGFCVAQGLYRDVGCQAYSLEDLRRRWDAMLKADMELSKEMTGLYLKSIPTVNKGLRDGFYKMASAVIVGSINTADLKFKVRGILDFTPNQEFSDIAGAWDLDA